MQKLNPWNNRTPPMNLRPANHPVLRLLLLAGCLVAAGLALAQTTYTVKPGDTLDGIGKQFGVAPAAIAQLNDLDNPNRIAPGMTLKVPPNPNAPITYTVKPGDTLGSIAVAHNTTAAALGLHNKIDDPKTLRAGQVLQIPRESPSAREAAEEANPLPASMKRLLDAMPVTKGKWKFIVIHHSASKNGSLQGMDMYHRQKRKMENGLAYHFVIGNGNGMPDGKIEVGNRWKRQIKGGHLASDDLNEVSIGICLVGNFEVDRPTAAQMKNLYALVSYLSRRCNIPKSAVRTHKQINTKPTACPGKRFPTETMLNNL
ncbi:MAG TPA: LysM peptidoglycan-binding domain-containing protein [Kiritimatiellia bacterium]|nr:LysM peptidoglycan-binding domain-containing protein [Kiritimatiellia bacterium]HMP33500.1 LysM peptidoglycan-binding domain-containing protein [Kiritimatiellia bacterium]